MQAGRENERNRFFFFCKLFPEYLKCVCFVERWRGRIILLTQKLEGIITEENLQIHD